MKISLSLTNAKSGFQLNSSGIAGFFGGEEAVSAMRTVNLYHGRRWMGWYNSPGSYTIAKRYGQLANSRIWDGFFPGPDTDAATLFSFAGLLGPEFFAIKSGTQRPDTGHLSALLVKAVHSIKPVEDPDKKHRISNPFFVTIVNLPSVTPAPSNSPALREIYVPSISAPISVQSDPEKCSVASHRSDRTESDPVRSRFYRGVNLRLPGFLRFGGGERDELQVPVTRGRATLRGSFAAAVPVLMSSGACVVCGLIPDWYCFTMILVGMLANGISCFVLGSGELLWHKPRAPEGCPPGDGILFGRSDAILLLGDETQVQFVTKGEFVLHYKGKCEYNNSGESEFNNIGICSLVLYIQFLAQLLLIPQGTTLGQILFISTIAVSWLYNCLLSSSENERLQRRMLVEELKLQKTSRGEPDLLRLKADTRTTMAVLVLLILLPRIDQTSITRRQLLDKLISNDTPTWDVWKKSVICALESESTPLNPHSTFNGLAQIDVESKSDDNDFLQTLYEDVRSALRIYAINKPAIDKSLGLKSEMETPSR
jgi:hypothetical protein